MRIIILFSLFLFGFAPAAFAGSANLRWDPAPAPTAGSGCSITAYQIDYGVATGTYTGKSRTSSGSATSLTVNGLDEGKTYFFVARTVGVCAGKELMSDYSNEVSGVIGIGKPLNLHLSTLVPTQMMFSAVKVGQRAQKTFSVENKGEQKVIVYPSVSPSGQWLNTQGGQGISPGGTGRFVIYFTPTATGYQEGRLELRMADGTDLVSYPLTGYAVP